MVVVCVCVRACLCVNEVGLAEVGGTKEVLLPEPARVEVLSVAIFVAATHCCSGPFVAALLWALLESKALKSARPAHVWFHKQTDRFTYSALLSETCCEGGRVRTYRLWLKYRKGLGTQQY